MADLIDVRQGKLMQLNAGQILEVVDGAAHHLPHVVRLEPLVVAAHHRGHFAQPGRVKIVRRQEI